MKIFLLNVVKLILVEKSFFDKLILVEKAFVIRVSSIFEVLLIIFHIRCIVLKDNIENYIVSIMRIQFFALQQP